jgi:hypothetical protein
VIIRSEEFVKASAITFICSQGFSFLSNQVLARTANFRGLDISNHQDQVTLLPISLPLYFIGAFVAVLASAGLFSMALAKAKGQTATLKHFWIPASQPWRFAGVALAATLAQTITWTALLQVMSVWGATAVWLGFALAAAPFYVFALPLMIDRGENFAGAFMLNMRAGGRSYFRLLGATINAFFMSIWGIVLCGIGVIWTQPNYQLEIVRIYDELIGVTRLQPPPVQAPIESPS